MKERPLAFVCLVSIIIGFFLVEWGGEVFVRELRPSPATQVFKDGETVVITGRISRKEMRPKYQIIYLTHNSIRSKVKSQKEQLYPEIKENYVLVYIKENSKNIGKVGNEVQIEGTLSFFDVARNPGNFDPKLYYQKQDIHISLFGQSIKLLDRQTDHFRQALSEWRSSWKQTLYDMTGEEKGAILSAMLLGEKSDMDEEIKELYRVTGIGHILAISGLHLSFVGAGVYKSVRRVGGSYFAAGIVGILFLTIYILMIGWSVSALRAVIMFVMRVGADMSGRVYDTPTALAVAAVTVIWWRPLSYYDSGFYLSFGAVLGATIVAKAFKNKEKEPGKKNRIWRYLGESIQVGVCIQLVTLPVVTFTYYEFPLYSIALNLLIIPLMSVILFAGIAGSILFIISPWLGYACIGVSKGILEIYEVVCRWSEELPFSRIVCGKPGMWQLLLFYGCLLLMMTCWNRRKNWRKGAVAVFMLGSIILCVGNRFKRHGDVMVTMIDVGQGDSIYIKESGGTTYLVDGGSSDVKSVGKYRIEPYLKQEGTGILDYVILTHSDMDHISGVEEMIQRGRRGIQIRNLVLPVQEVWDEPLRALAEEAYEKGTKVHTIAKGQQLNGQKLVLECIYPDAKEKGVTGNEASLVLSVTYKQFHMMLTGDLEGEGEKQVTEEMKEQENKTLLKVAHHGSKNSSSDSFLEAVSPHTAIISSGEKNRYGHPHQETIERLQEKQITMFNTAEQGAIFIKTDGTRIIINTQL